MNTLPPPYKFLLATFAENPDYFMGYILDQGAIDIFGRFNDNIRKIARNDVSMHELPKLNDEVISAWEKFVNKQWKSISNDTVTSPFEFLKRVVEDVMIFNESVPYFKISDSEIWNNLTFKMGEDLFSAVKFADRYIKHGVAPKHFQWNYILHSNFFDLNNMLQREKIDENHYHLFGSAPNVDLSWLFLMNNPDNQKEKFSKIEEHFALEQRALNTHAAFRQTSLHFLVKIAAYIRVRLFEKCCLPENSNENQWRIGSVLKDISLIRKLGIIINDGSTPYDMQSAIDVYKFQSYYKDCDEDRAIDYAIQGFETKENLSYIEIAGERNLYYCCLKQIFKYEEESIEIQILFYLYLLIKNKFGGIFIQRNDKYGFDNFHNYEETKSDFIYETIYGKLAVKMAVRYNIHENFLNKLELRITPKEKKEELLKLIDKYDNYSKNDNKMKKWDDFLEKDKKNESDTSKNHFYVIHFIKNKNNDWGIAKDGTPIARICRESKLREKIKNEALALNELRKDAREAAFRIYGIDAASHEVNCRPEIFGQAFRYLSNSNIDYPFLHYNPNKIHLPQLKKTYHTGEDFYDIVDGLRAIDEAILFLHLKHGDRIGHGVALGIDPEKYYSERTHIAMPLQNALDNFAWILYCIEKLGVNTTTHFYAYLKSQFDKYSHKLYGNSSIDLPTYIKSWKLRGDDPACYSTTLNKNLDNLKDIKSSHLHPLTEWDRYNLCYRHKYNDIEENVYDLCHKYHFDNELKKAAEEIVEIEVKSEYIELVKQLQEIMRNFVLTKGVAIESNPSSNLLISSLDKTIELPVFKLFPIEETENDLRLNVSINTDDQGVFYTSLVKEYTLLAGALQNEKSRDLRKYSDDKILTWIKQLVDHGKNQCFMQDTNTSQ